MAKRTLKERTIAYLEAMGYTRDYKQRTTKYAAYSKDGKTYFLGNFGAVHLSTDGRLMSAISVTDIVRKRVVQWEKSRDEA